MFETCITVEDLVKRVEKLENVSYVKLKTKVKTDDLNENIDITEIFYDVANDRVSEVRYSKGVFNAFKRYDKDLLIMKVLEVNHINY
jgi:hypothetical protein